MVDFEMCPDCDVAIGELHKQGCDISRCKLHGRQLISCYMPGGCSPTTFTGYFHGTVEAIERGWFSYLEAGKGWIPCDESHPDASPDLNRVMKELNWNSASERFE